MESENQELDAPQSSAEPIATAPSAEAPHEPIFITQTSRSPETGELVTGTEGENEYVSR